MAKIKLISKSIQMSKDEWDQLTAIATHEHKSISGVARSLIRIHLHTEDIEYAPK